MEADNSTSKQAAKPALLSGRLTPTGGGAGTLRGARNMVRPNTGLAERIMRKGAFDFTEALLLMGLAAGAKLLNLW